MARRVVQLLILVVLLGTATYVTPQTKVIGQERLVSIEPLPEAGGEICEPVPVLEGTREEMLLAALEQRQEAREAAKAARKAGAIVHGAPSARTTVVVRGRPNPLQAAGRDAGLKLMEIKRLRAKGHKITLLDERQFWRLARKR